MPQNAPHPVTRRRIFVTGATGAIGRRVIPLLVSEGHSVTAMVRTPQHEAGRLVQGAEISNVSLFDRDALARAFVGHDTVINLATHIPHSSWRMMLRRSWRENDHIRSEGSANVAEAALTAGVETLIQESFAPMYADGGESWLDETAPVRPAAYNESTLDAEASLARFTAAGRSGVVLRFAFFYGLDATHVPDFVRAIRIGIAPLPGDASAYFSSVSHDDAATAVIAVLNAPAGTYNVVDDEPLRRGEFFGAIATAFHAKPPRTIPAWMTGLMGSTGELMSRSLRMSKQKLRDATGWTPRFSSAREGFQAIARDWDERPPQGNSRSNETR